MLWGIHCLSHSTISPPSIRAVNVKATAIPTDCSLNNRLKNVTDALGEITSYTYDLTTNTTTVTNPQDANGNGSTETWVYDSYGMVLSHVDPLGNITTNAYDANHNLTSSPTRWATPPPTLTTPTGTESPPPIRRLQPAPTPPAARLQPIQRAGLDDRRVGQCAHLQLRCQLQCQPASPTAWAPWPASSSAQRTLQAGAIGFDMSAQPAMAIQFSYDANGNMISRTDALGRTTSYAYNSLGQKTSMILPTPASGTGTAASTTTYQYDAMGNLIQTAAPLGRTTSSTYDANGNKNLGHRRPRQHHQLQVRRPQPAHRDRLPVECNDAGHQVHQDLRLPQQRHRRDRPGGQRHAPRLRQGRPPHLGHARLRQRHSQRHLVHLLRQRAQGVRDRLARPYHDLRLRRRQPPHHSLRRRRATRVTVTTTRAIKPRAPTATATRPASNTMPASGSSRPTPATADYPDGTSVKNSYDGPGNLASVIDQAGNEVDYTYDAANQLKTVVQKNHPNPSHNTNSYSYDGLGNLPA